MDSGTASAEDDGAAPLAAAVPMHAVEAQPAAPSAEPHARGIAPQQPDNGTEPSAAAPGDAETDGLGDASTAGPNDDAPMLDVAVTDAATATSDPDDWGRGIAFLDDPPVSSRSADVEADAGDTGSGSTADVGSTEIDFAQLRLDGDWIAAPQVPASEHRRAGLAFAAALALHTAAIAASLADFATVRLGGGGTDLDAISVEIVSLEAPRRARSADARAESGRRAPSSSEPVGTSVEDSADSAAQVDAAPPQASTPPPPAQAPPAQAIRPDVRSQAPVEARRDAEIVVSPEQASERPAVSRPTPQVAPTDAETELETRRPVASPVPAPRQSAQQASAASAASTAEVKGAIAASAGTSTDSGAAAASVERAAGLMAQAYGAELVKSLKRLEVHLQRSNDGREGRARGVVELSLTINAEGRAENVVVSRSSGAPELDLLAVADISGFRFPPAPTELSAARRTFRLPITYR